MIWQPPHSPSPSPTPPEPKRLRECEDGKWISSRWTLIPADALIVEFTATSSPDKIDGMQTATR